MLEIILGLATWRATYMLQHEDGPGRVLHGFRNLLFEGGDIDGRPKVMSLSPMVKCFYCLSVWISIPFAAYLSRDEWVLLPGYVLGLSCIAIFLNLIHERL